jgi:hypothetical protein
MARAQADRLDHYATGWGYQINATAADIASATSSGLRLIDLEVRSGAPLRFDAAYVTQPGPFFYYSNLTSADEILTLAAQNGARPVDIERYLVSDSPRWSVVMNVSASGYILLSDQTFSLLSDWVAANPGWRMIDIERSEEEDRFHALFYPNEGADAWPWWWLVGVTEQEMLAFADANNARVFDVERNGSDSYDALMVGNAGSAAWYFFAELDSGTLANLAEGLGARVVDLDYYPPTGTSTVVLLENGLFFQDGFESGDLTSWGQK